MILVDSELDDDDDGCSGFLSSSGDEIVGMVLVDSELDVDDDDDDDDVMAFDSVVVT